MKTTFKGIELENLGKEVNMAHSRFVESDKGLDCFSQLLGMDKAALTAEQFDAMSALNSVASANYQICNGGLYQYFDNRYDKEREPFDSDDVKRVGKDRQIEMLRELQAFGREVFPEQEFEDEWLDRIIADFDGAYYEEEQAWGDEEDDWYGEDDGLCAPYDFDARYYKVNEYVEALIEAYAQFLIKSWQ